MAFRTCSIVVALLLASCASEPPVGPLAGYEELQSTRILDAPGPVPGNFAPENRFLVERGRYLVELLGCGSCHTDGALEGAPGMDRAFAGSGIGIAYMNPFGNDRPGVVYPPNITPDPETGIGDWSDNQIAAAIRAGLGRHVNRRIAVMPWQGYAKLNDEDANAIVAYLRSIKPVRNRVPNEVAPGQRATAPFVYFGVYRSR
jgi:mono/diheme cytochrome c family protein